MRWRGMISVCGYETWGRIHRKMRGNVAYHFTIRGITSCPIETFFIKHIVFNNEPDMLFTVRVVKDAVYEKSDAKLINEVEGVTTDVERCGWGNWL